tara:strand:- start:1012 stop:1164 length:153 start_codon:yes stop_codon:yes gene_type:complete
VRRKRKGGGGKVGEVGEMLERRGAAMGKEKKDTLQPRKAMTRRSRVFIYL